MRIVLHPEADAEFSQGVAYYASIDRELGERFLGEIKRLIVEISMLSGLGIWSQCEG